MTKVVVKRSSTRKWKNTGYSKDEEENYRDDSS